AGFVTLISARVVAINGPERWSEDLPHSLKLLLVNDQGKLEWLALLISQVPNLYVFWYLHSNAVAEGVSPTAVDWGLAIGVVLAVAVWWVLNAWYYFTYDAPAVRLPVVTLGQNAARTILFPRNWFWLNQAQAPMATVTIEDVSTRRSRILGPFGRKLSGYLNQAFGLEGYLRPTGQLYEAHGFAITAVLLFIGLYLVIWPLTAPVPAFWASVIALALAGLVLLRVLWIFLTAKCFRSRRAAGWWKVSLMGSVLGTWLLIVWLYIYTSAERFPTLASVLILSIALCWSMAGIAFFADRYRMPALTLLIALMILPRMLHLVGGREEHFFSTVTAKAPQSAPAPTPAEILDERLPSPAAGQAAVYPLIIVTSTGGGLHASAWTTEVLAHLEDAFAPNGYAGAAGSFHGHLLLLSTVSGGSVGLLSYLREIDPATNGGAFRRGRMLRAAQCSSLEAVGWGLLYYDFDKAFAPDLIAPSSGDNDLDNGALFKDRTWSLRKSFARNLDNAYCEDLWRRDMRADSGQPPPATTLSDGFHNVAMRSVADERNIERLESRLTLRQLLPTQSNHLPAFTMNTTSVEGGNRFLLANYRVPRYGLDATSGAPAQSFLDTFGTGASTVDLPLVTAAQLSATFPYVSSATRIATSINPASPHFVDGGYYDNDGTVSAIEFLRYALAPPQIAPPATQQDAIEERHLTNIESKLKGHPLRILWIEIRNSGDCAADPDETSAWNLFGQLSAPLGTFWSAGHESVTGRNRVALALFEQAQAGRLQIHRIVMADNHACQASSGSTDGSTTDPLNWSLTPRQRQEVRRYAAGLQRCYDEAREWIYATPEAWTSPQPANAPPCDSQTGVPGN
ncbi:MAG: hypothetical protein KGL37_02260, partial [Acidobacteriota bacterium]|nr:hypothetical protein [Acidobacteriota bacterium]